MITTETAVVNYLTNSGKTLVEAKRLVAKHYDIFEDFVDRNLDPRDCAEEILYHDHNVEPDEPATVFSSGGEWMVSGLADIQLREDSEYEC